MSPVRTLGLGAVAIAALLLLPAGAAVAAVTPVPAAITANPQEEWGSVSRIALVRADGSRFASRSAQIETSSEGLGDLFAGEMLIPGSAIHAEFTILRLGGGASALTLGLPGESELESPLAQDVEITVTTPTTHAVGGFAELLSDEREISLGVGEELSVPVQISVSLPASSTNITRERNVPFIIRATAAAPESVPTTPRPTPSVAPQPLPEAAGPLKPLVEALAATGMTVRDLGLIAAGIFVAGLVSARIIRRRVR